MDTNTQLTAPLWRDPVIAAACRMASTAADYARAELTGDQAALASADAANSQALAEFVSLLSRTEL